MNQFLNQVVSVHDPDEYLLAAVDEADRTKRLEEIKESYRALFDLKVKGEVKAIGIGSKDWTIIRELYEFVKFDWVMFANSFTIYSHPEELLSFMDLLHEDGVGIINSAVFHGGFTGGDKFDYQDVDPYSEKGKIIYGWREKFNNTCREYGIVPGDACIHFGISHPAIASIALNTSKPHKMNNNVDILRKEIPAEFWKALKEAKLIDNTYKYI
jgi:D-threo-aldose 1-dehydrogenase